MSWSAFLPEGIAIAAALMALIAELFGSREKLWPGYALASGFAAALAANVAIMISGVSGTAFYDGYRIDGMAAIFKAVLLAVSAIAALGVARAEGEVHRGEFYLLMSLSVLGAMAMASAGDLLVLFIALELTVLPSYAMAALKRDRRSAEAALKYFLLGMLASAIFIYGATLIFGFTGSISFTGIADALSRNGVSPIVIVGLVALVAGLGFKVSAVPFHFWAPDICEGVDASVAPYLAVGPKAGGFAALVHLFPLAFGSIGAAWTSLFAIIAVASMFVGNLSALSQTHVRRLLGYSGIAHAGYLLVGLAVMEGYARTSLAFYFLAYSAATLGAFLVVLAASSSVGESVEDFAGLSRRAPGLSLAMAVFLFSLVGLPPLAGFIGKFYLFSAAVRGGLTWLAVVGVVNSVISLGYYSSIIRQMYLVKPISTSTVSAPWALKGAIYLLVAVICIVGLYPSFILSYIKV